MDTRLDPLASPPATAHAAQRPSQSTAARSIALLVVAMAVLAFTVVRQRSDDDASAPLERPTLPRVDRLCREPAERAAVAALDAEQAARARLERYPFEPRAGVAALELLAQAEACATLAQDRVTAERSGARARGFAAHLERDLREAFDRYRVARLRNRLADAKPDLRFLLELLERDEGAFKRHARQELARIDRSATIEEP